jgi:isochorismate pyruvate lyase
MLQAIHCNTVQEVRNQIDRHGTLIVNLLAERTDYVFQAARFKNTRGAFESPPVSRRSSIGFALWRSTPDLTRL